MTTTAPAYSTGCSADVDPGYWSTPAGRVYRVAPLRLSDALPTYERTDTDYGAYAQRRVYVGADAVALLRAAGEPVADTDAAGLAIRVSQIADYDAENPITGDECSLVSLAVVAGSPTYRDNLPTDWTRDAWTDDEVIDLEAETVAHIFRNGHEGYSTDAGALALRALSLSGARGITTVSLLSHSTEWLGWRSLGSTNGYVPGDAAGEIGDALAYVPAAVIRENYRTASGDRVDYDPARGWVVDLRDVNADVQAWAEKIVHETVSYWDTYVRGEVYGVEVEITTTLSDDERESLDDQDDECVTWEHDAALWGVYGEDADPTSSRGDDYAIVDQLAEVCYSVLAERVARREAARRLEAGGTYVI